MLLQKFCMRALHTTRRLYSNSVGTGIEKSALAALRKKTGYTFANCKKALELHNNDINLAEKWLHEQAQSLGWTKATKVADRATTQGLIGVLINGNRGAMVELNCETDFVARNDTFKRFVDHVARICLHYTDMTEFDGDLWKLGFDADALKNLRTDEGRNLGDHLALLIGAMGENASIRRALCFKVNNDLQLVGYAHPAPVNVGTVEDITQVGKYGAIIAFRSAADLDVEFQKSMCQQIVGMKPKKIGEYDKDKPAENKDDETCLIHQEYLLDADRTVGEVLQENQVTIVDYHRFECGEQTERHIEDILQSKQQSSN
ncbi:elongation factor Ts, mitochondrial [Scaptodrosophila lebanonensis]|uniref:Elongation factor Ts, mitochondrial n=1 Tax=Drosophila lebanonensis TaxID=7225 RepID=A0A6J2U733_DROLE|nr:elongation factor Ts, mitochondrial [Scaptodrosophila lebanonensis]